jgi:phosphoribosylaminoimidazolecarboxamide formyltransferase/IMP cyclohydrolase
MSKIARALLSVSDKTGLAAFAQGLAGLGIEILSTGGTARVLREAGVAAKDISQFTGFPEILEGRVKTLHPKVHGGLLYRREAPAHVAEAKKHGIEPIDLVVVNLYPFEKTVAKPEVTAAEAIEEIDIGGPSMLRSSAKNWESVTVVTDPQDYAAVLEELKNNGGAVSRQTRLRLAAKVFALTSRYDGAICAYLERLGGEGLAPTFSLHARLKQALRYGENPHQQRAALFLLPGFPEPCLAHGRQLSGKEPGFNNLLDLNTAFEIVREFSQPAACIVKHNNPCGAAVAGNILEAWQQAYAGDPLSAFGGVLALNRPLDQQLAEEIISYRGFKLDALVAPVVPAGVLETLSTKKKWGATCVVFEAGEGTAAQKKSSFPMQDIRTIPGGVLVQDADRTDWAEEFKNLKTVTRRAPTAQELDALKFAWVICKHVKSNAIVLAQGTSLIGVGAGQMSRVDSVEIAVKKAGPRARGTVLASDAFFPFPDGPEAAAVAGVTAFIQPGGSVKDEEVIAVCDRRNLAMVFTGIRHFRH